APDPGGPSPSDVTGLQLWLKANNSAFNGFASGDQITTWNDSSGNSRNATGVVDTTSKPKWQASAGPNSRPAILLSHYNGSTVDGGYFTLPNFLSGSAGNAFAVVKIENDAPSDLTRAGAPMSDWGSSTDEYYPFTDGKVYYGLGSNSRKTCNDPTTSLTTWH